MKFIGPAFDMNSGSRIQYPAPTGTEGTRRLKYDFLFTGYGAWRYSSSTNALNAKGSTGVCRAAQSKGESWVWIDSVTGEVAKSFIAPNIPDNLKAQLQETP